MVTDVARWLDARNPAMPEELRRAVDAALDREGFAAGAREPVASGTGTTAERLAAAGLAALERSIGQAAGARSDRDGATDLLAADALLTYACEAAAEEGPEALDRLTQSLDFRRFEALLEPDAS